MCDTEEGLRQYGEAVMRLAEQGRWRFRDDGPDVVISERIPMPADYYGYAPTWKERARIPMPVALRLAREMLKQHDAKRRPLSHDAVAAMEAG